MWLYLTPIPGDQVPLFHLYTFAQKIKCTKINGLALPADVNYGLGLHLVCRWRVAISKQTQQKIFHNHAINSKWENLSQTTPFFGVIWSNYRLESSLPIGHFYRLSIFSYWATGPFCIFYKHYQNVSRKMSENHKIFFYHTLYYGMHNSTF